MVWIQTYGWDPVIQNLAWLLTQHQCLELHVLQDLIMIHSIDEATPLTYLYQDEIE